MLGSFALKFAMSSYGRWIIVGLAFLAALKVNNGVSRRRGRKQQAAKHEAVVVDRTERGKDAYTQRIIENARSGVGDIGDRVRSRDTHWGRLPGLR